MNPFRAWKSPVGKWCRSAAVAASCLALGGCLPEDEILSMRFSPDEQVLSLVTRKKGLCIADPANLNLRSLVETVETGDTNWSPDGRQITFVTNIRGNADIAVTDREGNVSTITGSPARETDPLWLDDKELLFLASDSGRSELFSWHSESGTSGPLLDLSGSAISPRLSPSRKRVAFWTVEDLRPQVYVLDVATSSASRVTSETKPLSMVIGSLAWAGDEALLVLRDRPEEQGSETVARPDAGDGSIEGGELMNRRGTRLSLLPIDEMPNVDEKTVAEVRGGIAPPPDLPTSEWIIYAAGNRLVRQQLASGSERVMPLQSFGISHVTVSTTSGQVAFACEEQIVGIAGTDLRNPRLLTFTLEDKLLLAEEYLRKDLHGESARLYEELAESVERTGDPAMLRFLSIVNHSRLGNTRKAAQELELLLHKGQMPAEIPPHHLWRVLGFAHLLGTERFERAKLAFRQYTKLRGQDVDTSSSSTSDPAINAYAILQQENKELAQQLAAAIRARLEANLQKTDEAFARLLQLAPDLPAVQSEYLRGLDGYEQEVYYYSPSQRSFEPSLAYRANYLERFLQLAAESHEADQVKMRVFLLRIEQRQFERARELLREALQSPELAEGVEGITEIFANYLEVPESQPWLESAMGEVFLHPAIRPLLEERIDDKGTLFLTHLAAVKLALTQRKPDLARTEADRALALWQQLQAADEESLRLMSFYIRLRIMRAREAELRGLFAEAAGLYDETREWMLQNHVGDFETYVDVRYRAALLRHLLVEDSELIAPLLERERIGGDELVNPTWETSRLAQGLEAVITLYDAAGESGEDRSLLAFEAGILLRKLYRPWQARAALLEATNDAAPIFVRERAYIELASLDENGGDPWNSARWYGRAAGLPTADSYLQDWLSYHMARQNIRIRYNVPAALEALSLLLQNNEGTPLGIHAEELLSTSEAPADEQVDEGEEQED